MFFCLSLSMLSRYIESSMNYVKYLQFYMLGNAGYSYQLSTMFFFIACLQMD